MECGHESKIVTTVHYCDTQEFDQHLKPGLTSSKNGVLKHISKWLTTLFLRLIIVGHKIRNNQDLGHMRDSLWITGGS